MVELEETEKLVIQQAIKTMDSGQRAIYYEQKKKNPGLAAALSFLIPGIGQIYLGHILKGIIILFTFWLILPWIYGIYDAYKTANDYNADLYLLIFANAPLITPSEPLKETQVAIPEKQPSSLTTEN